MQGDIDKVLGKIKKDALVLDVGGCSKPLARADFVIDFNPYEKRGKKGLIGAGPENFNKNTWVVQDICSRQPFPFKDKQFDFVFCSHTLEDVKDPVWVCQEIMRVGKKGYIETPSRWIESKKGVGGKLKASRRLAGYFNHQWFVEVIEGKIIFTTKTPLIHVIKEFQIKKVPSPIIEFFWQDNFKCEERLLLSFKDAIYNLMEFKLEEIKGEGKRLKLRQQAEKFLELTFGQKVGLKLKNIWQK